MGMPQASIAYDRPMYHNGPQPFMDQYPGAFGAPQKYQPGLVPEESGFYPEDGQRWHPQDFHARRHPETEMQQVPLSRSNTGDINMLTPMKNGQHEGQLAEYSAK